jgi:predicted SAM-dependent RNA methyltransferase
VILTQIGMNPTYQGCQSNRRRSSKRHVQQVINYALGLPLTRKWTDRTAELRKKGYEGRRLGPVQMTTDTAVRVTRIVIQDQISLDKIEYVDHPELKINQHESTQMPFRYVKGDSGEPVMPEVREFMRSLSFVGLIHPGHVGSHSKGR